MRKALTILEDEHLGRISIVHRRNPTYRESGLFILSKLCREVDVVDGKKSAMPTTRSTRDLVFLNLEGGLGDERWWHGKGSAS